MPGVTYRLLDRRWLTLVAAELEGQFVARAPEVGTGQVMMIDVIALSADPPVGCTCALFHGDPVPQNYITRSLSAAQDTYEGQIEVPGGTYLSLAWSGQVAAARLTAKVHYSLLEVIVNPTDPTLAIWRGPL